VCTFTADDRVAFLVQEVVFAEMTWPLPDVLLPSDRLGALTPFEILYEFDGPLVFTALSPAGRKLLACASFSVDADSGGEVSPSARQAGFTRYLISPTSDKILERLRNGAVTLHDALDRPRLWAADIADSRTVVRLAAWGRLGDVPANFLLARNRTLWPRPMPLPSPSTHR